MLMLVHRKGYMVVATTTGHGRRSAVCDVSGGSIVYEFGRRFVVFFARKCRFDFGGFVDPSVDEFY